MFILLKHTSVSVVTPTWLDYRTSLPSTHDILLLLLWGVCHSTSCYVSKNYRSHTIRPSLNRELNCLEEYITIYCNLLINMVKNDRVVLFFFRKLLNFVTFTLGEGGCYWRRCLAVSPTRIVTIRFTTQWTGNWISLKNTSRYFVIYSLICYKMRINSCNFLLRSIVGL